MFTKLAYCVLSVGISVLTVLYLYNVFDYNNTLIDICVALLGGIMVSLFAWGYHVVWGFKYFD